MTKTLIAIFVSLFLSGAAQAAGLCAYPTVSSPLDGTECFPLNQAGVTKTTTTGTLSQYLNGSTTLVANSMAALRAFPGTQFGSAMLQGYFAAGDGGEGTFTFNPTSTATDDGGVVIAPNTGVGRWIRNTYSTKPNVRWWGAPCNWNGASGASDSAAFQAAVAWGTGSNGAQILIPRGASCTLSATVTATTNNITFVADGYASVRHNVGFGSPNCTSSIYWAGATSGVMFSWASPSGSGMNGITGGGMNGVCLYGMGVAGTGISASSVRAGVWTNLYFDSFTTHSFYWTVNPNIDSTEPCDDQNNEIRNIQINNLNPNITSNGQGFAVSGYGDSSRVNAGCNFSDNTIENLHVETFIGTPIFLGGSDNNKWSNITTFTFTGGVYGIDLNFGTVASGTVPVAASSEYFFGVSAAFIARGTTSFPSDTPSVGVIIVGLDKGNGSPNPVLETGAQLSWYDSTGHVQNITGLSTGNVSTLKPTLSSCGASPSLAGNNVSGVITVGTGSPTSCQLTFSPALTSNARCAVQAVGSAVGLGATPSATTLSIFANGTLPAFIDYICVQ